MNAEECPRCGRKLLRHREVTRIYYEDPHRMPRWVLAAELVREECAWCGHATRSGDWSLADVAVRRVREPTSR